jgi:hypothetical protein
MLGVWPKSSESQDLKSLKNIPRIESSGEEATKLWNQTRWQKREHERESKDH